MLLESLYPIFSLYKKLYAFYKMISIRPFSYSLTFYLLLVAFIIKAQPLIKWDYAYGGSSEEELLDVKEIAGSRLVMVGTTISNNMDGFIPKENVSLYLMRQ